MGYVLKAFVGKSGLLKVLSTHYPIAHIVDLYQDIGLVPMTDELFDEIALLELSEDLPGFDLMTLFIEKQVLELYPEGEIAYFEAEYFGCQGSQSAIIRERGQRSKIYINMPNAINLALQRLGVSRSNFKDEFDSLHLGRHRDTNKWVKH